MLTWTFCHMKGIGVGAEANLWARGVLTWADLEREATSLLSPAKASSVRADTVMSREALEGRDWGFFLDRLPCGQRARVWPDIRKTVGLLDVETTGLCQQDRVTTAVLDIDGTAHHYVAGTSLDRLGADIAGTSTLVTYNGIRFDLPFLERDLGIALTVPHIDLCPELRAHGYHGGLKACERQFRLVRARANDLTGQDAIRLWQEYRKGRGGALAELLAYNTADARVLGVFMDRLYALNMRVHPAYRRHPRPSTPSPQGSHSLVAHCAPPAAHPQMLR